MRDNINNTTTYIPCLELPLIYAVMSNTVCDVPRYILVPTVEFASPVIKIIFPHLSSTPVTFCSYFMLVSMFLCRASVVQPMMCLALLFLDFEQNSCNTSRNQEVAALILFPQAPDPTTAEA